MRVTLGDRLAKLKQRQARLEQQQAALKEQERKARTRRLIQIGGLVEKAGLLALDTASLYGALISIEQQVGDEKTVARWGALGRSRLQDDERARGQDDPPSPEISAAAE